MNAPFCFTTQMVMGMLKMQNPDEMTFQSINFNFYTTSAVLQVSVVRG